MKWKWDAPSTLIKNFNVYLEAKLFQGDIRKEVDFNDPSSKLMYLTGNDKNMCWA